MAQSERIRHLVEAAAPIAAGGLIVFAGVDMAVGLNGDAARLAVLIGGAVLVFVAPKLRKLSVSKDGAGITDLSIELVSEAINAAKEASEKSKQLLIQGAGAGQAARMAATAEEDVFDIYKFVAALPAPADRSDPQKGRFGHARERNGWSLSATSRDYNEKDGILTFNVFLRGPDNIHADQVYFVLHPTITPSIYVTTMRNGRASIFLRTWGAFTIGAVAKHGEVLLELDLAEHLRDAPQAWRDH